MNEHIEKQFKSVDDALSWLNQNSGLWAGLAQDDMEGCADLLHEEGRCSIRTPLGNTFVAIMEEAPAMTSEPIGTIELGCDGSDQYILFKSLEDDISPDDVYATVLPMVYRDTQTPGGYFCHRVRVMQTDRSNEVICVIEHRYDV